MLDSNILVQAVVEGKDSEVVALGINSLGEAIIENKLLSQTERSELERRICQRIAKVYPFLSSRRSVRMVGIPQEDFYWSLSIGDNNDFFPHRNGRIIHYVEEHGIDHNCDPIRGKEQIEVAITVLVHEKDLQELGL